VPDVRHPRVERCQESPDGVRRRAPPAARPATGRAGPPRGRPAPGAYHSPRGTRTLRRGSRSPTGGSRRRPGQPTPSGLSRPVGRPAAPSRRCSPLPRPSPASLSPRPAVGGCRPVRTRRRRRRPRGRPRVPGPTPGGAACSPRLSVGTAARHASGGRRAAVHVRCSVRLR
jgi:hypothetical protein